MEQKTYPCAKWYPFKFRRWIIQWSGGKICVNLCDLWETKIIIRGGRNDLSVGKDITDPLYLPLKIRLSERRRSLFVLPSVRILSKAGRTGLSASWVSYDIQWDGWKISGICGRIYNIIICVLCSPSQYRSALVVTRMENVFYSTFDRITSGEVPIRVIAEILWPPLAFNEWPQW